MKKIITLISLVAMSSVAYATTPFHWNGFINQTMIKTSDGLKLGGDSDRKNGSFDRAEIGGNASYQYNENIDLRGMISFEKDGSSRDAITVNYALADIHSDTGLSGIRVGRYSYDYGFYNAARNNPMYRDMELPPQGIYRDGFKQMTRSGDGFQLYVKKHLNDRYSAEIEIGYGKPVLYPQKDLSQTFVLDKNAGKFTDESRVKSLNLTFDDRNTGIVVKYGYLQMDYQFSTKYVDNGEPFPMITDNRYLGIRKYFLFGDLTLEAMKTKMGHTKWDDLMPLPEYQWGGVEGYSITYKHYLSETISAIIGYDTWYVNKKDRHGNKFESMTYTPNATMYHESINLGIVYRKDKISVRAELHHVKGTNTVRAEDNNILSQRQPERYNIGIVSLTYKFN